MLAHIQIFQQAGGEKTRYFTHIITLVCVDYVQAAGTINTFNFAN